MIERSDRGDPGRPRGGSGLLAQILWSPGLFLLPLLLLLLLLPLLLLLLLLLSGKRRLKRSEGFRCNTLRG
jgi:hypothetical protein